VVVVVIVDEDGLTIPSVVDDVGDFVLWVVSGPSEVD